jgi:hypothetical protein
MRRCNAGSNNDDAAETETPCTLATALVIAGCRPGQRGTKKLLAEYGAALVCVRYRYDEASRTRIKTAEIIVEKTAWTPPARTFADNDIVPVRIAYPEEALKASAKAAKGRWNPDVKLWFIRYGKIKGTALEKHIVLYAGISY